MLRVVMMDAHFCSVFFEWSQHFDRFLLVSCGCVNR